MQHWKLIALAGVIMHSTWLFDYSRVKCERIDENTLYEIEEGLSTELCETLVKLMENSTNVQLQKKSNSILVGPIVKSFNCSASLTLWNERQDDNAVTKLEELLDTINRTDLKMLLHAKHEKINSSGKDFVDFVDDTIQNDNKVSLNWDFPSFEDGINYRYVAIIVLLILIIVIQTYKMSVHAQKQIQVQENFVGTNYISPYECDVETKPHVLERKYSDSDDSDDDETTIHFVRTTSRQRYQVKDNEPLLQ